MAAMDDVERQAQGRGYEDGRAFRSRQPGRYDYTYTNHVNAYDRGWRQGKTDYERLGPR